MASIRKRATKGGVVYDVHYRDMTGASRQKSFPRKAEADKFRATVVARPLPGDARNADPAAVGQHADRQGDARGRRRGVAAMDADGLSASTIKKARGALREILALAVRSGAIRANPVDGTKIPSGPKAEHRYLTPVAYSGSGQ